MINTETYLFLNNELKKANDVNIMYNSLLLNSALLALLVFGGGLILYCRYSNKQYTDANYEEENRKRLLQKMMQYNSFSLDSNNINQGPMPLFTNYF
tara:strand:+ start:8894 stop:9184 length:291 start_codon:yes stop_codon:yes gene_type:complete